MRVSFFNESKTRIINDSSDDLIDLEIRRVGRGFCDDDTLERW